MEKVLEGKQDLEEMDQSFQLLNSSAKITVNESHDRSRENIENAIIISGIISVVLIVFVLAIAVFITRNISKSLSFFKDIFSRGVSGHLTVSYPVKEKSKDEINELGVLFNDFMSKLREVIKEVIDASNELSASSEELSVTLSNFADNSVFIEK